VTLLATPADVLPAHWVDLVHGHLAAREHAADPGSVRGS
jgi:hypothetical protein